MSRIEKHDGYKWSQAGVLSFGSSLGCEVSTFSSRVLDEMHTTKFRLVFPMVLQGWNTTFSGLKQKLD